MFRGYCREVHRTRPRQLQWLFRDCTTFAVQVRRSEHNRGWTPGSRLHRLVRVDWCLSWSTLWTQRARSLAFSDYLGGNPRYSILKSHQYDAPNPTVRAWQPPSIRRPRQAILRARGRTQQLVVVVLALHERRMGTAERSRIQHFARCRDLGSDRAEGGRVRFRRAGSRDQGRKGSRSSLGLALVRVVQEWQVGWFKLEVWVFITCVI